MKGISQYKCLWLCVVLVILYLTQPYLNLIQKLGGPFLSFFGPEIFLVLLYTLTLAAAIYATTTDRFRVILGLSIIIPALIINWLSVLIPESDLLVHFRLVSLLLALGYTGICLLLYVLSGEEVTLDQIFGGVSIYFLIGHGWALLFAWLEFGQPGSFTGLSTDSQHPGLVYYSFVTLTTLGYGEITPATPQARSLAALEAVMGVLYIAILISRLVSMYKGRGPNR